MDKRTGTPSDYAARARALAPSIAAAGAGIESQRELPVSLVSELHQAGLFRMLLPSSLGGAELPPAAFVRAIEEIAKLDASAAWCIGQTSICSTIAASLEPKIAADIFCTNPPGVLAWGPPGPSGKAVEIEGGYRISGHWKFASGSRHATWLAAHMPVFDAAGQPAKNSKGAAVEITALFPRGEAEIHDIWHVMGLKGTGSDAYSVSELFVPRVHTVSMFGRNPEERRERGPLYQFTVFQLFGATFGAIALGIASATFDAFVDLAKKKNPAGGTHILRDNAVIQSQVGVAAAHIASSRVFLLHALDDMWNEVAQTGQASVDKRIQLRMASSNATHRAREAVDLAYHAAGGTAIFESNPFERRFRDIHTVSQQVQSHFSVYEAIGQHFLGMPLHPRLI
jgi:indole-3-acetate monooxygenase